MVQGDIHIQPTCCLVTNNLPRGWEGPQRPGRSRSCAPLRCSLGTPSRRGRQTFPFSVRPPGTDDCNRWHYRDWPFPRDRQIPCYRWTCVDVDCLRDRGSHRLHYNAEFGRDGSVHSRCGEFLHLRWVWFPPSGISLHIRLIVGMVQTLCG